MSLRSYLAGGLFIWAVTLMIVDSIMSSFVKKRWRISSRPTLLRHTLLMIWTSAKLGSIGALLIIPLLFLTDRYVFLCMVVGAAACAGGYGVFANAFIYDAMEWYSRKMKIDPVETTYDSPSKIMMRFAMLHSWMGVLILVLVWLLSDGGRGRDMKSTDCSNDLLD